MKKYDMEQFRTHCASTVELGMHVTAEQASADYLLRFWYRNKDKFLYKLMGEELILSKEIRYERSLDELTDTMIRTLRNHRDFEMRFWDCLQRELYKIDPCWDYYFNDSITDAGREANRFYQSLNESMDPCNLSNGARVSIRHRPETSATTVATTICGKEIVLSEGQKVMKVVGKLAEMFGLSEEFEMYRIAHSQALNQKTISGTLHLSIHPLDYATASDNNNGWDSCMSWYNKGCYRLGTIEMMNSPCVICAYLTGKNVMEDVGGGEWNSKKWRAWIIVDKEIIALNRQYPYHNENLAKSVLDWVADLASANLGWEYEPFENEYMYNDHGFYFECGYMYNDFDGECPARVRADSHGQDIYFSGPANCMWCGAEIEGDIDAGTTICNDCNDVTHCTCCGDYLREDDTLWGPDDMPYCYDCYNSHFTECDTCNEVVSQDDIIHINIPFDERLWKNLVHEAPESTALSRRYNWYMSDAVTTPNREISLCKDCLRSFGVDEDAILYHVEIPFNFYKYSWSSHYASGNILDPRKVTFEQACDVYNISTEPSIREAWKMIWKNYAETLYTHGTISRE